MSANDHKTQVCQHTYYTCAVMSTSVHNYVLNATCSMKPKVAICYYGLGTLVAALKQKQAKECRTARINPTFLYTRAKR